MSPQSHPEQVVLLDEQRQPSGTALKSEVHGADTPLHLAFSCYVFNAQGQLLISRRALDKLTWPGVWTNSFCGHPGPGESFEATIARRARQELGMSVSNITCVLPEFSYRATDASGVIENEFCPVFTATTTEEPQPVPSEVAEYVWWDPTALLTAVTAAPFAFSPWLVEQTTHPLLRTALTR